MNDVSAFTQLAKLHTELSAIKNSPISIDLGRLTWIDAHLSAPLLVLVRRSELNNNVVTFQNISDPIRQILSKNKFLQEVRPDRYNTTMPVSQFTPSDGIVFSEYAKKHLGRPEMPKMSRSLQERFFEGVDELFANSALHAQSLTPIVVSGQFFPKLGRFDIAICDGGRGFQGALRDALRVDMPAEAAIDWAMTPNNTTRQGDIPGGLGSKILREFIQLNNGKLIVVSNDGYWRQHGSVVSKQKLKYSFPGSFVILEIDTTDQKSYDLAPAPDPRDIW